MLIDIQPATPDHAAAVQSVKDAVWPDDATSVAYIRTILAQPDHQTHLALADAVPAGFISGFLTLAATGTRRWEIDLLAVHPDFRRRGLAVQLIRAALQTGIDMGADLCRALIHVENIGSQTAFSNCGFQRSVTPSALYISTDAAGEGAGSLTGLHLIPVSTLNYRGVWLEGQIDAAGLRLAQAIRNRHQWDVAGGVLSLNQPDTIAAAEACGYFRVGDYAWWQL